MPLHRKKQCEAAGRMTAGTTTKGFGGQLRQCWMPLRRDEAAGQGIFLIPGVRVARVIIKAKMFAKATIVLRDQPNQGCSVGSPFK